MITARLQVTKLIFIQKFPLRAAAGTCGRNPETRQLPSCDGWWAHTRKIPRSTVTLRHGGVQLGATMMSKYVVEKWEGKVRWFVHYEDRRNWRCESGEEQPEVSSS